MTNDELSLSWVQMYEHGKTIDDIAKQYQKSSSTIYTWLKKRNVKMRHTKKVDGTWKEVPVKEAIQLYEAGMPIAKVAEKVGFDEGLVRYAIKKNGVKTKRRNNPFTDNEVIELYKDGFSMEKIASMFNVSRTRIKTVLNLHGIDIRQRKPFNLKNKVEAVDYTPHQLTKRETNYTNSPSKYSNSHKVYTDENFFNKWSHELAYFLGWMASDGNISEETNTFRITSTDIEHLENLFSLFSYGWTTTIREWDKDKYPDYKSAGTISIARKDIMDRLIDYGIPPNKSLTIEMPYIPRQYMRDFVRGVFEGDGCITFKCNLSPKIVFATGSEKFAYGLGEAIERQTGLKVHVYINKQCTWTLEYNSIASVKMLFKYMYEGVPSELILKRKYDAFIELFKKRGESIGDDKHQRTKSQTAEKDVAF